MGKSRGLKPCTGSVGDNLAMSEALSSSPDFSSASSVDAPVTAVAPVAAPVTLPKSDLNMVWLDCEMTGLNPNHDRIIEIAVVVTNADLSVRIEGPVFAIHQSDELLNGMDAWNKGTHGKSGLIERVKASTMTEQQAEAELIAFLIKYVPKGKTPLCGNSIGQDRRFMERYMPKLNNFFHYRNIDVSTLKELAKRWKPTAYTSFKKAQRHTAMADVHESIDELQHYRKELLSA